MQLIFELSRQGRSGYAVPAPDVGPVPELSPRYCRQGEPALPEVSELDVVRHFSNLARMNFCVDTNFYPLGSCTMKYNPKFTERVAEEEGFRSLHPLLPQLLGGGMLAQGALEVLYECERLLSEITGMSAFTLTPLAGAHGELTGIMMIAAYHRHRGSKRRYVLVPDSSHGTNPASAAIAGYEVVVIPTASDGYMDMDVYRSRLSGDVAAVMLTCPDTLGIFNPRIKEIADLAHRQGALMYYDGANLNAILGKCRPGDLGFDVVHVNLHKTFGTPHGGGGPGAGPVGVTAALKDFLPLPRVCKRSDATFALEQPGTTSIGNVVPFYGNFAIILRAYAYMLHLGKTGLIEAGEHAVLNANYCKARLKEHYEIPYPEAPCLHEFVLSAAGQAAKGVRALDIAKFLIDRGMHPPTVYFPLIVQEAMMIEPTETESRETLDIFIDAMIEAARCAAEDPARVAQAPRTMTVGRLDETLAAREPNLRWKPA